jgi:hypothetical protein
MTTEQVCKFIANMGFVLKKNDDRLLPADLNASPRFRSTLHNARVIKGCQIGSVREATVERTNIPPTNGIQQYLWILTNSALIRSTEHSRSSDLIPSQPLEVGN